MEKIDRITGCILGGALGDALGHSFEGQQNPVIDFDQITWEFSDDTQLTLATCEAIIELGGKVDPAAIAASFARWHKASRITGMGASTLKALTELSHGGHWALVGAKGEYAAGSGAAMRIAPLAFCLDPSKRELRQLIRDVSRITHHNEEAYAGALAVVIAVRATFDGTWAGGDDLMQIVTSAIPDSRVRDRLLEFQQLEKGISLIRVAKKFGGSGYVVDTVPLAILGAQRASHQNFETVMTDLITAGGDTDTTASIAGQIIGTLIGPWSLPKWTIIDYETIVTTARVFAQ